MMHTTVLLMCLVTLPQAAVAVDCQVLDGSFIGNGSVYRPNDCSDCDCVDGELECVDTGRCTGDRCIMDNGVILYEGANQTDHAVHIDSCNTCRCTGGNVKCSNVTCSTPPCSSSVQHRHADAQKWTTQCIWRSSCICEPEVVCWGINCECYHPDDNSEVDHGESYRKDECTTCLCNDGHWTCSNTCCLTNDGTVLDHGELKLIDGECKTCECDNTTHQCTSLQCADDCVDIEGSIIPNGEYARTDACNTCFCKSGTTHCTNLDCSRYSCAPTATPVDLFPVPEQPLCSCEDQQLTCVGLSEGAPCQLPNGAFISSNTLYRPNDCADSDCHCFEGKFTFCQDTGPSSRCTEDDDNSAAIAIGCAVGGVAVALAAGAAIYYFRFSKPIAPTNREPAEEMSGKELPSI